MTYISAAVGVFAGVIGVYFFMVGLQSLIRTRILQCIIQEEGTLKLVQETFALASSFALLRHRTSQDLAEIYEQGKRDAEEYKSEHDWLTIHTANEMDKTWTGPRTNPPSPQEASHSSLLLFSYLALNVSY